MIGPVTKNGEGTVSTQGHKQYVHAESQEVIHKNDANGYCKSTERRKRRKELNK